MAELLLFNIRDPEKRIAISLTALRLGLALREVPPEQQHLTIAELLENRTPVQIEKGPAPFEDELLLMHALSQQDFHTLLDTLRRNGQSVRLKAVVTDHNRSWTASRLHRELLAEEQAMQRWNRSRHGKDK